MFYRESGQLKSSYIADQAMFPIAQDRWFIFGVLALAFLVVPFFINEYWANAILLPFLVYALAALGLNILTGYCGRCHWNRSLHGGGCLCVIQTGRVFPEVNFLIVLALWCRHGSGRYDLWFAQSAYQGLLPRCGHARSTVFWSGSSTRSVVL